MGKSTAFAIALALALSVLVAPAKAQWLPTSGPPAGSVKKLLLHGGALYAATQPAGIFKTLDSGRTWTAYQLAPRVSPYGATGSGVMSMAALGRFIFAGTMDSVQRSGDGGKTWERCNKGLGTNWVDLLAAGQGAVYAGYWDKLFRSLDSGATWTRMLPPDTTLDVEGMAVIDSFLYIGMEQNGMYRSSDRGETWTRIEMTGANDIYSMHVSQGVMWAGDYSGRVHRSKDDGKTWARTNVCFAEEILALAGTPSALYAACGEGLYRSSDTGATWGRVSDPELYVLDWEHFDVVVDGGMVYGGGSGGVIRIGGGSRAGRPPQFNFGLGRQYITAVGSSSTRFYAGYDMKGYQGVGRGSYWERLQSYAHTTPSAYLPFAGRMLAATVGSDVGAGIRSITDEDQYPSSQPADSGLRQTNVFALARIGNALFAGSASGVFRSTDSAKSWQPARGGLEVIPAKLLIAGGTSLFGVNPGKGLFRSPDQGETWTAIGAGLRNPVTALAYAGDVVVAAADSGREVFRSLDQGATWTRAQTGLTAPWVRTLASSGTRLLAGTTQGLYRSLDGGMSWHPFMEGMFALGEGVAGADDFHITSLAVGNLYLVAGTARGTVWQRPVSDLSLSVAQRTVSGADLQVRRYFDAARGTMVFESAPVGAGSRAVTAQGRRLPKSR